MPALALKRQLPRLGSASGAPIIWRSRWNGSGKQGLCDRSSRPASSPRQTQSHKRERIIQLRRNHRLIYAEIARRVGVSAATVGRICSRAGVDKLPPLQAVLPQRRYERHLRTRPYTPAPTARQSASSRRCCGNGLMLTVTPIQMPVPANCHSGSNTTISTVLIWLSVNNRPLHASVLR